MTIGNEKKLFDIIYQILQAHPQGLTEYELLKKITAAETSENFINPFSDNHKLFKAHFILFHLLYRLRNELWQQQSAHLEITPLNIQLLSYQEGSIGLGHYDGLMDYYLNFSNLDNTTPREVDEMLGAFYVRFNNLDKRQEALQTLGLEDPVDEQTIKTQYRRLAMQHHPDRGGDKQQLQAINAALQVLIPS